MTKSIHNVLDTECDLNMLKCNILNACSVRRQSNRLPRHTNALKLIGDFSTTSDSQGNRYATQQSIAENHTNTTKSVGDFLVASWKLYGESVITFQFVLAISLRNSSLSPKLVKVFEIIHSFGKSLKKCYIVCVPKTTKTYNLASVLFLPQRCNRIY